MTIAVVLALGEVAGCYLHHGREHAGPCDGLPIDEPPLRTVIPLDADEPAVELVGRPTAVPGASGYLALVSRPGGFGLFSTFPARFDALDTSGGPLGSPTMMDVEPGTLVAAFAGGTYAVAALDRTTTSLSMHDEMGHRLTPPTTRSSGPLHVSAAGSACFAVASRDAPFETSAARLTFVGTDGAAVAGEHSLTSAAINDPISVTVGARTVALWHETLPGRVMFAQAFEAASPVTAPTAIEGELFGGLMQGVAIRGRIAIVGVTEAPPYRLRVDVLDPESLGRTTGGGIEASRSTRVSNLVVAAIPEADAVALCTTLVSRRGEISLSVTVVSLDGVQWGSALVIPGASVGACHWTGSEIVGAGRWPSPTGEPYIATFRLRPTFF